MKAVFIALAILSAAAFPPDARAVEWRLLAQSDNNDSSLYYVEKSVKMLGNYVRLQTKRVYSEERGQEIAEDMGFPLPVRYTIGFETVDCRNARRAVQKISYYGPNGKILDRTTTQAYSWQPFNPTGLTNAICERFLTGPRP